MFIKTGVKVLSGKSVKQRKIGVLTSGGDAPGMNAAIRAVVRAAQSADIKAVGIKRGFDGLLSCDIVNLEARSVSDTIHRGGTILLTARSEEMYTDEGRDKAANVCRVLGFSALIVIGGDGSFKGGLELSKRGVNVIGIPATIDLDIQCTDYTIGFDTAVNTVMDAITKIRDTSSSHERCSIVEVMGRNAGHIALWCSMTGGAEEALIPEKKISYTDDPESISDKLIRMIIENRSKGKTHNLIIIAEGVGGSAKLATDIENATKIETRALILGHLQRGGSPTALDRMRASVLGYKAIEAISAGEKNKIIVVRDNKYLSMDLEEALTCKKEYDDSLYEIMKILSV